MLCEQRAQFKRLKLLFDLNGEALVPFSPSHILYYNPSDLCLENNIKFPGLLLVISLNSIYSCKGPPLTFVRLGARI